MIENSDKLILDYLGKVGDLAQTAMPARERAQFVAKLRDDIDRQRRGGDSPAAVRKILGRLGSPDEVVSAAGQVPAQREPDAGPRPVPAPVSAPVPVPKPKPKPKARARAKTEPKPRARARAKTEPKRLPATSPEPSEARDPHPAVPDPAGPGGLGVPSVPVDPAGPVNLEKPRAEPPEWWRTQPRRRLTLGEIAALPGVTIPLDKPEPKAAEGEEAAETEETEEGYGEARGDGDEEEGDSGDTAKPRTRRRWPRGKTPVPAPAPAPVPAPAPAPQAVRRRPSLGGLGGAFMETLAALALLAGAVLGSWLVLLIGWVMAYYSRRLSPAEARFAALGLPGTVFVATMVWLWGRTEGRWGEPLAQGQLGAAVSDAFPWMVRVAAVGSAAFVLWRSRGRTVS